MGNRREIERQALHIAIGLATVYFLYTGLLDPLMLFLLIVAASVASVVSLIGKVPILDWFLKRFERGKAVKTFPGMGFVFFFVGSLLALKLFPMDIALASIMILTLGDSVSHLFGIYFGRTKNPMNGYKLLEGSFAGLIAGYAGALIFVGPLEAFVAASFAMAIEAAEIEMNKRAIDDNLLIPLVAGTAALAVRNDWLIKLVEFIAGFWVF